VARAEQAAAPPRASGAGAAPLLPLQQRPPATATRSPTASPSLQTSGRASAVSGDEVSDDSYAEAPDDSYAEVPDDSYFVETGYYVGQGAIWEFFASHEADLTFGPPLSNVFTLEGRDVQIFRNHVLEVDPDGSVGTMALLDSGAVPSTRLGRRTVPDRDASLVAAAPATTGPNWRSAAHAFAQANAPDVWDGLEVDFLEFYLAAREQPPATSDSALLVWGLPVSKVVRDPARPELIHLRWERGVMEYNSVTGRTQPVPLGELFKAVLTGEGLPAELAVDAQGSPYYRQYGPAQPLGLVRPDLLPDSSLEGAFEPNVVGGWPSGSTASSQLSPLQSTTTSTPFSSASSPTASPTPTLPGDGCTGAEEISYVPDRPRVGAELLVAVTSTRKYAYPRLAGTERTTFVQERPGQLGFVYEWTVNLTYPGDHDYTFYVDSTVPCKRLELEVRDALGTVSDDSGNDNFSSGNDNDEIIYGVVTATPTPDDNSNDNNANNSNGN
jgi:hypothetical protein